MRDLREVFLAFFFLWFDGAVGKQGSNSRLFQTVNGAIGMLGRRVYMAPVHDGRCAGTYLPPGTKQITQIGRLGRVHHGDATMDIFLIIDRGPVARDAPQSGLPGMQVSVDQTWNNNGTGCINDLCVTGFEPMTDR